MGLAHKTVKNAHRMLHRAFTDAVAWDYTVSNPAEHASLPREHRGPDERGSTGGLSRPVCSRLSSHRRGVEIPAAPGYSDGNGSARIGPFERCREQAKMQIKLRILEATDDEVSLEWDLLAFALLDNGMRYETTTASSMTRQSPRSHTSVRNCIPR